MAALLVVLMTALPAANAASVLGYVKDGGEVRAASVQEYDYGADAEPYEGQEVYDDQDGGERTGAVSAYAASAPGKVSFLRVKTYAKRKGLNKARYNKGYRLVVLYWSKASNASKYQILYATSKNGTYKKAVKSPVKGTAAGSELSYKLNYKLGKKIFFKVVAYNGTKAGPKSDWVGVKVGNTKKNATSVKITGGNATLYPGVSKSYTAALTPSKSFEKSIRWISSNTSIAKVSSSGKVTGVNEGVATIYALAHDGVKSSVKITVADLDTPEVTTTWNIKSSTISWNAVSGAEGYVVYSRITRYGTDVKLATVGASEYSYKDTYYNSSSKTYSPSFSDAAAKKYLKYTYYLDPAVNPLVYTVKAFKKVKGVTVYSRGGEDFHLETPAIIAATDPSGGKVTLTWGKSMMADGYYIYRGDDSDGDGKGGNWDSRIAEVKAGSSVRISRELPYDSSKPFYTVKAYATRNGKHIDSGYDKTFRIDRREYSGQKVLFIGDSITFGTPYAGVTDSKDPYYPGGSDRFVFNYPRRLRQLTGAQITNVSVAGATYSYIPKTTSSSNRCLTGVNEVVEGLYRNASIPGSSFDTTLSGISVREPGFYSDYDVVVLSAGTNDVKYYTEADLGALNRTNVDNETFIGAVNKIMTYIEEGSRARVAAGKEPIKVVFVDMFYRANNGSPKQEKMDTYQECLHAIADMWNGVSGMKTYKCTDSRTYVTSSNAAQLTSDFLHLTRFAQGQFGSMLADYLISNGIITK